MFRLFTSQMAVTRTSSWPRKFRMSPWPWAPTPMTPSVILFEGAAWPAASRRAGTRSGATRAASMALRRFRRVVCIAARFIVQPPATPNRFRSPTNCTLPAAPRQA